MQTKAREKYVSVLEQIIVPTVTRLNMSICKGTGRKKKCKQKSETLFSVVRRSVEPH
jgi:hypothetical protein